VFISKELMLFKIVKLLSIYVEEERNGLV